MISRRELEELGVVMTDEQWAKNCEIMAEMQDRMWEEDHPLDD